MINSTPDFPPFTPRQLARLEELKAEIEKRDALLALDPGMPKINERIDELSVKVLRFASKNIPKNSRRPGEFSIEVPTYGGRLLPGEHRLEIKPGFCVFHPDLPPWAGNHFIRWSLEHRALFRRWDGREVLRETGIVGIETGIKRHENFEDIERREHIKRRVLELRGVAEETGKKRTRKPSATWNMVIDTLVEEKLLSNKITYQAFKKWLKQHFYDYLWDNV